MVLLRRVIGDALRARRQGQHRTLREVSTAANVSLGYLSEIERGQKEASSELLAAICDALGAQLSDVLRQVTDTLAVAEEMESVLAPVGELDAPVPTTASGGGDGASASHSVRLPKQTVPVRRVEQPVGQAQRAGANGSVTVSVRHDTPLRTTLRATRRPAGVTDLGQEARTGDCEREVVCVA